MAELDPRFRIRAPLRCDGIGRLDCAEDAVSGDRLAVRWVPLEANGELAVKACEKLPQHPTLPRILQTGQVGVSAFVAIDFPMGETLAARGEEPLENEPLLKLAAQLSDALATVHAQSVVHGEMNLDSVLLTAAGQAVLWDMPLVIANRLADRRGENRLMQNLVKTAPYLAPERARGEGASTAADVYALGAVLCVAGGSPLPSSSTTLGAVHQVSSGEWKPRVPSSLPDHWRNMLGRMISTEASDRPSAVEVAMAFARVPGQHTLPTVPELPAVRLPTEILLAADVLMKSQVDAMRAPTREIPVELVQAAALASVDLTPVTPTAALPLATDAMPQVELAAPKVVEPTPHPFLRAALHAAHVPQPRTSSSDAVPAVTAPATEAAHPFMRSAMHARTITGEALIQAHGTERDAVRIPTVEFEMVRDSVPLNDGISVSRELLADGAALVAAEEVADHRRVWSVFGAMAGAALALVLVVVVLARREPEVVTMPVAAATPVAPVVMQRVLEELAPLPRIAAPPKPVKRAVVVAPVEVKQDVPPVAEVEVAPAPAPVAPQFEFLEAAEAPKNELKRPEL